VNLLLPKIVHWINRSLQGFMQTRGMEPVSSKMGDLYNEFRSGVIFSCLLWLYVKELNFKPDLKQIFEHPLSKAEFLHNLSYIGHIAVKNNVPVYLNPQEYLEYDFPQFIMVQLYYLYCKFKDQNPVFTKDNWPSVVFKDEGRILENQSQISGQLSTPARSNKQLTDSSEVKSHSMGVIDEVDSMDFSSTFKSPNNNSLNNHTSSRQNMNNANKMQQFMNPQLIQQLDKNVGISRQAQSQAVSGQLSATSGVGARR